MLNDLRQGIRALCAAPGFTVVAAGTLAVGIAVNTIAFTLLNSLALRPMPVRDAARVMRLYPVDADGQRHNLFSYPDYRSYREQLRSFDGLVAYIPSEVTIGFGAADLEPQAALAYATSANYFPTLGLEPSLGRAFTLEEESEAASGRVAVISHSLWEHRYASARDVIGKTVVVNGRPLTIVGVGPRRFVGTEPLSVDVWLPVSALSVLDGDSALNDRNNAWLLVVGQLVSGQSRETAEQEASVVAARLAAAFPARNRPARAQVMRGTFFPLDRELEPVVTLVMATIGLVLVIACANIANLSLARAAAMRRQVAVRLALGAGWWRILRYQMIESLLIAMCGGAWALLLSAWTVRLLHPIGLSLFPETWGVVLDLTPDVRVFGYTLLLSLAAALLFGLAPALQLWSSDISAALRGDGSVFGRRISRSVMHDGLVVLQIAVCLMLLATAALTARSLQRTRSLDLGFRTSGLVYTHVHLRRYGYSPDAAIEFYRRLAARAAALPGLTTLAWTTHVPLTGGVVRLPLRPEGHAEETVTKYTAVSPSYFEALDVVIVRGRVFTDDEAATGAAVAVISEGLARRFWPAMGDAPDRLSVALGKRITLPRAPYAVTVVGVARDAVDAAIWREKELSLYLPADATRDAAALQLIVRTEGETQFVATQLRQAALAFDRNLHLEARPLQDVLRFWQLPARVAAIAAASLGGLALLLAAVGIYGVIAHAVSQRTREIGIRIALGARGQDVLALMLGAGARLVALGIVAGLAGTFTTTRFLKTLLAGVDPLDPLAVAAATTFLAVTALLACYLPTRRAAAVDPLVVLRVE